jgi:hypothetical protein
MLFSTAHPGIKSGSDSGTYSVVAVCEGATKLRRIQVQDDKNFGYAKQDCCVDQFNPAEGKDVSCWYIEYTRPGILDIPAT